MVGIIIISLILLFPPKTYTRTEVICINVGNIDDYYNLLKYENFKRKTSLWFWKSTLYKYNKNCKEYNQTEEKLIDELYEKALQERKNLREERTRR